MYSARNARPSIVPTTHERILSRTVRIGVIAVFVAFVYIAVVGGLGDLLPGDGRPHVGLSLLATILVALGYPLVDRRTTQLTRRMLYRGRPSPAEVLELFSGSLSTAGATEASLFEVARLLAEGTRSDRVEVWLRAGPHLVRAASWPESADEIAPRVDATEAELGLDIPGVSRACPVLHGGDLVGALAIVKPRGEPVTPPDEAILKEFASLAGLVLRNIGLATELRARVDEIAARAQEIRASRQRIVQAQDAERRELERNIHDGAQQHLVALAVRLNLARRYVARDSLRAASVLEETGRIGAEALDVLRDLSTGLYSRKLTELGLGAALRERASKLGTTVEFRGMDVTRQTPELEAAVYFSCLEALQNAEKHADASRVIVTLRTSEGRLEFVVEDDGRGFEALATPGGMGLRNMRDRIVALNGELSVKSQPGRGTRITGWIPVPVADLVPA